MKIFHITACFWLIGALSVARVFASTIYTVVPLPIPSTWSDIHLTDINNSAQVVGYGSNPAISGGSVGDTYQSFITTTSFFAPVPLAPGFHTSLGQDISDAGEVTGYGRSDATPNFQGFVGNTAASVGLPLSSGYYSSLGYGINDAGKVAGYGFLPNLAWPFQAFLGDEGGITPISHSTPWFGDAEVFGINNSDQFVGIGDYTGLSIQAFIGGAGGLVLVPLPVGYTSLSREQKIT